MILVNALMCPDGTIIQSHHRHDYISHRSYDTDGDSPRYSFIDGGYDYVRGGGGIPITITDEHPFEVIRMFLSRGGRGKDGSEPLSYTPLFAMSDEWLDSLIKYEQELRPNNRFLPYYIKEREYRLENGIKIRETRRDE